MNAIEPSAKWWDELPEDFYRQADGTELDAAHPLKVHGTAAIDLAMRTALSAVIAAAVAPQFVSRKRLEIELERLHYYDELTLAADSRKSFPPPPRVQVQHMRPRTFGYRPIGIPYQLLRFDSPFQTLNPELRESYGRHLRNQQACAQHWYHRDGPRPTLIVIHGFMADSYWFNAQMFSLRWFYQHGYDILLYTLPFHGYRVESGDWFSGYNLFAQGLAQFNEAMAQAVHDLRIFMDHLQRLGVRQMGVTGLSLGGYTSALMAAVDKRLAFCIPNSPVVSPADLMREWQPTGMLLAAVIRRHHISVSELRGLLAVHSPLTYAPKIAADRMLIIGGAGDRFTPPRHVRLLHRHWPGSRLHWFPGNHLLHLRQGEYLRVMKRFMDQHTQAPPMPADARKKHPVRKAQIHDHSEHSLAPLAGSSLGVARQGELP